MRREFGEDHFWYTIDTKKVKNSDALELFSGVVDFLDGELSKRNLRLQKHTSLYKDREIDGFEPDQWGHAFVSDKNICASYNVIKSCVDSVVAKITQQDLMPDISTFGADMGLRSQAKLLQKFIQGYFQEMQVSEKLRRAFHHACVGDIGAIKFCEQGNKIVPKLVHQSRLLVDERMSINGDLQVLYEVDYWGKFRLAKAFPEKANEIMEVPVKILHSHCDMLKVIEGWALPFGGMPGKHMIAIPNQCILLYEDWNDDDFPFVFCRWEKDLLGWYGVGLVETLRWSQEEINEIADLISENRQEARPCWLVDRASGIITKQLLSNEENRIVEFVGQPPARMTPPAVSQQEVDLYLKSIQFAYEKAGISQLTATSRQPRNFESGAAMRSYVDIETIRFSDPAREWEQLPVRAAKVVLACAERMKKSGNAPSSKFIEKDKNVTKINYKDIKIARDEYTIRVFSVPALPQHPAARLETVLEMQKNQIIQPEEAKMLADVPDLDKFHALENAEIENAHRTMEYMLSEEGKYIKPSPFINHMLWLKIATQYYHRAILDNIDENLTYRVELWINEAASFLPPPMPEGGMGQGGEGAPPMPGGETPPAGGIPNGM
jgi:hypothetical protein